MDKRQRYKLAHRYTFYRCLFEFEDKDACTSALYALFDSKLPVAFIQRGKKAVIYVRDNTQLKAVANLLAKRNIKYGCKVV